MPTTKSFGSMTRSPVGKVLGEMAAPTSVAMVELEWAIGFAPGGCDFPAPPQKKADVAKHLERYSTTSGIVATGPPRYSRVVLCLVIQRYRCSELRELKRSLNAFILVHCTAANGESK